MKVRLKAQTEQIGKCNSTIDDHVTFSGLNAGICYMPDTYDALEAQPELTKFKRGQRTIGMTHHSVSGHVTMEVIIEDIPKICAMILNNLGEYNTSEKSGRYTKMEAISDLDGKLYKKWIAKLMPLISQQPNIDEKKIEKLAMENARYMLSVFIPTTMGYSTSIRQFNYIIDWSYKMYRETDKTDEFYYQVAQNMKELADQLSEILYVQGLRDTKNRSFNLFNKNEEEFETIVPFFDRAYQTTYKGTFVQLADVQRHRTLDYQMFFDGTSKEFYVPPIIRNNPELVKEWMDDITSVAHLFPQGTLVKIFETGKVENFILKCKERECSAAQLEVQMQTALTHFNYENAETLSPQVREYLSQYCRKVRCGFRDFKCSQPCKWGINSLDRLV